MDFRWSYVKKAVVLSLLVFVADGVAGEQSAGPGRPRSVEAQWAPLVCLSAFVPALGGGGPGARPGEGWAAHKAAPSDT